MGKLNSKKFRAVTDFVRKIIDHVVYIECKYPAPSQKKPTRIIPDPLAHIRQISLYIMSNIIKMNNILLLKKNMLVTALFYLRIHSGCMPLQVKFERQVLVVEP